MDDAWHSIDVDPSNDTVWVWGPNLTVDDVPASDPHLAYVDEDHWWSALDVYGSGEGKPVDGVTHWRPFIVPDPPSATPRRATYDVWSDKDKFALVDSRGRRCEMRHAPVPAFQTNGHGIVYPDGPGWKVGDKLDVLVLVPIEEAPDA